jgi:hypothetical protein
VIGGMVFMHYNVCPAEIHRRVVEVHGYRCMSGESVKEWRLLSEDGVTNVHEEQRSGRKFLSREI